MTPGPFELLLIIVVILLLFGGGRVPSIMENLAKGMKSFKQGLKDDDKPAAPSVKQDEHKD